MSQSPRAPVALVELVDLADDVAALGLRCRAGIDARLLDGVTGRFTGRVTGRAVLEAIRAACVALADDPALAAFRAALFDGVAPAAPRTSALIFEEARRFVRRARAGLAGISASGLTLALRVEGATIIAGWWPVAPDPARPTPYLSLRDAFDDDLLEQMAVYLGVR